MTGIKRKSKKTKQQIKAYKRVLNESPVKSQDTTETNVNPALVGSDEYGYGKDDINSSSSEEVAPVPLKLAVKDWIKEHSVEVIITSIIVPFSIWMVTSILNLQGDRRVEEYRLEQIEANIESMDDDFVGKEILSLQLEALEQRIDDMNIEELEERITLLEKEIAIINSELERHN